VAKELIKKALQGDPDALEGLISQYQGWVYNIARKIVKTSEDAHDVTQEVCLKLFTSLSELKDVSKFSSWLYRITYHTSLNWRRLIKKTPALENPDSIAAPDTDDHSLAEIKVEKEEDIQCLTEAIKELPYHYQVIIKLFYFEERSYEEITELLGMPMGTVKTQLFRGKKMLEEKFKVLRPGGNK